MSNEPKPDSPAELAAERERFEAWFVSEAIDPEDAARTAAHLKRDAWGDYDTSATEHAWQGWLAAIASIQARPVEAWISVEDRLPDEDVDVWIAAWAWNDPVRGRLYGRALRSGEKWINPQDDEGPCVWWPPTHWMPLPAAPTKDTP